MFAYVIVLDGITSALNTSSNFQSQRASRSRTLGASSISLGATEKWVSDLVVVVQASFPLYETKVK